MDQARIDRVRNGITNNEFVTGGAIDGAVLPPEYIKSMNELGEKYRNIRWLPLDIPKIKIPDIEEFKSLWDEQCHSVLRIAPDAAEPWEKDKHPLGTKSSWHVPTFNGLHLWHTDAVDIETNTFAAKMYKGKVPLFERLVEQAFDLFPIHSMSSIFIWQSVTEVLPHRDRGSYWKCPDTFRVMLHDENDCPTLYTADIEHGDAHYIDLPEDTNSFCWSNGTQIHGSDYYEKRKWLLVISGFQSPKQSERLFEKSIRKYKDNLNYKLEL